MAFFEQSLDFAKDSTRLDCFRFFDETDKQYLDENDFRRLISSLLNISNDALNESIIKELFVSFDSNADSRIDAIEFDAFWNKLVKPLKYPITALLIIDVQNDFIDGSLALKYCNAKEDGFEVVPVINELIEKTSFDILIYSMDYHPKDHISFFDNVKLHELSNDNEKSIEDIKLFDTVWFQGSPKTEQKLWPRHCEAGTWGSELHEKLKVPEGSVFIHKGTNPKFDSYSAFGDNMKLFKTELDDILQQKKVTHVFICGLAYEYCVSSTALDALELGYATVFIEDASRAVDRCNVGSAKEKLVKKNCVFASCSEIDNLVKGKDIRLEFMQIFGKSTMKH